MWNSDDATTPKTGNGVNDLVQACQIRTTWIRGNVTHQRRQDDSRDASRQVHASEVDHGRTEIVDAAEARRFVAAAQRRGQSIGEWVKGRGIDGRSLQAWKMTFGREGSAGSKHARPSRARAKLQRLVELVPNPAAVTRTARYVLECEGVRLEFGDEFADDTLRRVLLVLRSC